MADFDTIPVRLPSGGKAIVQLPRPFTTDDAAHLIHFLSGYIEDKAPAKPKPKADAPLTRCASHQDGDCTHAQCPQLRDNEPRATGRHCPLDVQHDED